jgi:alpha-1,3-rhamnosyl/mannosyltransferase
MRVLINTLAAVGTQTGIGHYITQTVRCLAEQAGADRIDTFPQGWMRQAAGLWSHVRPWALRQGGSAQGERGSVSETGAARPGWKARLLQHVRRHGRAVVQRRFSSVFRRGGYELYHEPNFIPLHCDAPIVATVHDLSVVLHPEWHPADRVHHFETHFQAGLARCCHFLAISESARREIIRTLGLRPDQVTRTYMGIRPGLGPLPEAEVQAELRRLGLPPRYLLYLGTIEPRKNVLTLLRAYGRLPASVREQYPLLLVGGWGWNSADVAAYLHEVARHQSVIHLGYLPERLLPILYNGARALVFPTFYEGFGLPPVEMLACGGAVLASTAEAIRETVGSKAHLVDPLDLDGWQEALERVVTDEEWWQGLRDGAREAARPFTWEQCAADTLGVYRRLAGPTVRAA